MSKASFRFADELSLFLAPQHRGRSFAYDTARAATLKNAIEALGVPHTEIGTVTVNGEPVTLQRTVREGDAIHIGAFQTFEPGTLRFIADAHLGALGRFLRMLGFDTLHDQRWPDAEIRRIAHAHDRIVLTRDRDLLKCRDIARGAYVRAIKPELPLQEMAARYRLAESARPFTLCLCCNVRLEKIEKAAVVDRVPPRVLELQDEFTHCSACGRIYWPGTHYERMKAVIAGIS